MKRKLLGIAYCTLWYMSILVGFFVLICPLLPLVFLHPRLYRKWSEIVFGIWEPFPVALMEIFFGIRAVLTGDSIDPFERSLLIMNHRTRLDWNFLWVGLFHCCHPYSHALKYVLKAAVMHFPGPGWVMQTCSFLFIHRKWEKDQNLLERMLRYLDISDQPYQILLFPEGTDLTPSSLVKSHKYADEHNLERYYNVLHPKTTGFAFLAHKMKFGGKFNAVYDITVGYPGKAPQNEMDLLKGEFPEEVHFHVKRYSGRGLPSAELELKAWLNDVWRKKENLLKIFHQTGSFIGLDVASNGEETNLGNHNNSGENSLKQNSGSFSAPSLRVGNLEDDVESISSASNPEGLTVVNLNRSSEEFLNRYRPSHLLYLTFLFWVALIYIATHQLFVNFYVQIWVLVHTIFFSFISLISEGFHHIIASIYFYRCNMQVNDYKKK